MRYFQNKKCKGQGEKAFLPDYPHLSGSAQGYSKTTLNVTIHSQRERRGTTKLLYSISHPLGVYKSNSTLYNNRSFTFFFFEEERKSKTLRYLKGSGDLRFSILRCSENQTPLRDCVWWTMILQDARKGLFFFILSSGASYDPAFKKMLPLSLFGLRKDGFSFFKVHLSPLKWRWSVSLYKVSGISRSRHFYVLYRVVLFLKVSHLKKRFQTCA